MEELNVGSTLANITKKQVMSFMKSYSSEMKVMITKFILNIVHLPQIGEHQPQFLKIFFEIIPIMLLYKNTHDDKITEKFLGIFNKLNSSEYFQKYYQDIEGEIRKILKVANLSKEIEEISQLSDNQYLTRIMGQYLRGLSKNSDRINSVVYTPAYIGNFMIKFASNIFHQYFSIPTEELFQNIIILDPATGTFQFEFFILNYITSVQEKIPTKNNPFNIQLHGFEINPWNFLIGWFFFTSKLCTSKQRIKNAFDLRIKLENALTPSFLASIQEINDWEKKPLLIIGNPPYSVSSNNKGIWITNLLKPYSVPEPNITRLYDDYVKFIRYGHLLLLKHRKGILSYITNRKFLDGKIYYGMRKSLLNTFDYIYIIDLHGDSRNQKQEMITENVFGIQTGICIVFFIKKAIGSQTKSKPTQARIYYKSIKGKIKNIQDKLNLLDLTGDFTEIIPTEPKYLFIPLEINLKLKDIWENQSVSLQKCFKQSSRAMITSRDKFMINLEKSELKWNLVQLETKNYHELRLKNRIKSHFDPILENETILNSFNFKEMHKSIRTTNYRPFDKRFVINYTINRRCGSSAILNYLDIVVEKTEINNIENLLNNPQYAANIGLNFVQSMQKSPFNHSLVTTGLVDSGLFGYSTSKVAPFWINLDPNIDNDFSKQLLLLDPDLSVSKIFGYIYGILQTPCYAKAFEPYLFHHFPKIILPIEKEMFNKIASLGVKLIGLHLGIPLYLEQKISSDRIYQNGNPSLFKLEKLCKWTYLTSTETLVLIFEAQDSIKQEKKVEFSLKLEIWNFSIGSIQVIKHWLKARIYAKSNILFDKASWKELEKLLYVISHTLEIRAQLNNVLQPYLD